MWHQFWHLQLGYLAAGQIPMAICSTHLHYNWVCLGTLTPFSGLLSIGKQQQKLVLVWCVDWQLIFEPSSACKRNSPVQNCLNCCNLDLSGNGGLTPAATKKAKLNECQINKFPGNCFLWTNLYVLYISVYNVKNAWKRNSKPQYISILP